VGPRAGLDSCGKCYPLPGLDPRAVQSVASLIKVIPRQFIYKSQTVFNTTSYYDTQGRDLMKGLHMYTS
jgi:hypothetical protein